MKLLGIYKGRDYKYTSNVQDRGKGLIKFYWVVEYYLTVKYFIQDLFTITM